MSVWRVEISYDAAAFTGLADGTTSFPTLAYRALTARDGNFNHYAVRSYMTFQTDPITFITARFSNFDGAMFQFGNDAQNPFTWGQVAGPFTTPDVTDWLAGGLIAIEKDGPNDRLSFITPGGTLNRNLSGLVALGAITPTDDSPLIPEDISHRLQNLGGPGATGSSERTKWFNISIKRNGAKVGGAAMSAANPAPFGPPLEIYLTGDPLINNNAQETTRYRTELDLNPPFFFQTNDQTETLLFGTLPTSQLSTAMAWARQHGIIWRGGQNPADFSQMIVQVSYDRGHTWASYTMYSVPGTTNDSPSLNWSNGRLVLVWSNGTNILTSYSIDNAVTWSTPLTLPYSGSNPRHIVDPESGLAFYFFLSSGSLKLARSGDNGHSFVDAAPITVAASVPTQQVDATLTSSGGIMITFFDVSNLWQSLKSYDLGNTWA